MGCSWFPGRLQAPDATATHPGKNNETCRLCACVDVDSFYFNDDVARFFESGNVEDLANAMLTVIRNTHLRDIMVKNALQYVERNSWAVKERDYLDLVDSLTLR